MDTYTVNLKDLLRLAFEEPCAWLTPEPQASGSIHWVTTSPDEARHGDLLLLPASCFDLTSLDRARKQGVVALLLVGETPTQLEELPAGLPIAAISNPSEVRAAQQSLLTTFVNQRAALVERDVRIHAQLSQLAAEGEGLDGLVRAIGGISSRGVLLQDKRLGILAHHPSTALGGIWDEVLDQICTPDYLPESLRERKRSEGQTITYSQQLPGGLMRLIAPIVVGDVARGYLSLIGQSGELDAFDHLVAQQGALVCAVEMARAKAVREAEKRLKGDLLTALLQEDLSPRDARLWVQNMGLDLTQAHAALRFTWGAPSSPSRRRLETIISGEIARYRLKVIVSPMGGEIICICQLDRESHRPDIALTFGQAVLDQGYNEYPEAPIRCGIGTPALNISDWRFSFRQAGQALEMARRLRERKPLYFPNLSVYRLLLQIEHSPELIAFQEETLGPLLAHEGADEMVRTLEAYFEHNGNLSQAAEALYIHRNTLLYRMERIAAITNLDINQPETRLAVQLALHIHRMMGEP